MNNIPEKAGLSQPRLVDEMKWNEAQGTLDTKTWRLANAIKRHCRLLRPASLRQQVYMLMKLLKESEMLEADCIVGFVSRLLDKPEPQVRAMYANFDEFTKGEVGQAQGRPKLLTENQIAEVVAKVRSMVVLLLLLLCSAALRAAHFMRCLRFAQSLLAVHASPLRPADLLRLCSARFFFDAGFCP